MPAFKDPSFQDRAAAAARAKTKALEQLRAKPPLDEAEVAAAIARREARDAAQAERRAQARAAKEEAEAAKRAAKAEAEAAAAAEAARTAEASAPAPKLSEAERKALRDARYAARKNRKGSR